LLVYRDECSVVEDAVLGAIRVLSAMKLALSAGRNVIRKELVSPVPAIIERQSESMALGCIASRVLESTVIVVGIDSVLSMVARGSIRRLRTNPGVASLLTGRDCSRPAHHRINPRGVPT
jgi:hypothetical protein